MNKYFYFHKSHHFSPRVNGSSSPGFKYLTNHKQLSQDTVAFLPASGRALSRRFTAGSRFKVPSAARHDYARAVFRYYANHRSLVVGQPNWKRKKKLVLTRSQLKPDWSRARREHCFLGLTSGPATTPATTAANGDDHLERK